MEKEELKRLLEAHDWVWEKWWPALLALPPDQAQRAVGGSFPSVFATTAHMVGTEAVWLERLLGNPQAPYPPTPADMQGLQALWQGGGPEASGLARGARPESRVFYHHSSGSAANRVDEIVLHFTSHTHFHRGQLAAQFRLLGLTPPSAHWIGFFRL